MVARFVQTRLWSLAIASSMAFGLSTATQAESTADDLLQYDPATHCGVVIASRQTLPEITELLTAEIAPRATMQLYQSQNGWYALLHDSIDLAASDATIAKLKADGDIPDDAFCSSGRLFTQYIDQSEYFPEGALTQLSGETANPTDVLQFDPATECGLVVSSHESLEKVSTYLHEEYAAQKSMQLYRSQNGWYAIVIGIVPDALAEKALTMGKEEGLLMEDSFCTKGTKYVEFIEQKDYFPPSARELLAEQKTDQNPAESPEPTEQMEGLDTATPESVVMQDPEAVQAIIDWARQAGLPDTVIPNDAEQLFAMTYVDLQDFGLTALPVEFGVLQNLQSINLYDNQLSALPQEMGELSGLTALDIGHNQLIALPESIGRLSQLKRLNVSDNKLTALPPTMGELVELEYLALSNNELLEIPSHLQSLENLIGLYLSGNSITQIPDWVEQLPRLQDLVR